MLRRKRLAGRAQVIDEDRKHELVMAAIGHWIAGGAEAAGAKAKNTGYGGRERQWFEGNREMIQQVCEEMDQMVWDKVQMLEFDLGMYED